MGELGKYSVSWVYEREEQNQRPEPGKTSGRELLSVEQDGKPVADAATAEPLVSQALDQVFERFARCALLVEV